MKEVNKDVDAPLSGLIDDSTTHLRLTVEGDIALVEALAATTCSCGFVFEGSERDARLFMARCAVRHPHPKIIDATVEDNLRPEQRSHTDKHRNARSAWQANRRLRGQGARS